MSLKCLLDRIPGEALVERDAPDDVGRRQPELEDEEDDDHGHDAEEDAARGEAAEVAAASLSPLVRGRHLLELGPD